MNPKSKQGTLGSRAENREINNSDVYYLVAEDDIQGQRDQSFFIH